MKKPIARGAILAVVALLLFSLWMLLGAADKAKFVTANMIDFIKDIAIIILVGIIAAIRTEKATEKAIPIGMGVLAGGILVLLKYKNIYSPVFGEGWKPLFGWPTLLFMAAGIACWLLMKKNDK